MKTLNLVLFSLLLAGQASAQSIQDDKAFCNPLKNPRQGINIETKNSDGSVTFQNPRCYINGQFVQLKQVFTGVGLPEVSSIGYCAVQGFSSRSSYAIDYTYGGLAIFLQPDGSLDGAPFPAKQVSISVITCKNTQ
jgi:hypothetical protein